MTEPQSLPIDPSELNETEYACIRCADGLLIAALETVAGAARTVIAVHATDEHRFTREEALLKLERALEAVDELENP